MKLADSRQVEMLNTIDGSLAARGEVQGQESVQTPPKSRYWIAPSGKRWAIGREGQVLARYRDQHQAVMAVLALSKAELFLNDAHRQTQERTTFDPEVGPSMAART